MTKIIRRFCMLVTVVTALGISACSTTMKAVELNEQGLFETGTVLFDDEVTLIGDFKDEYRRLVYVKTDEKEDEYNEFFMETFNNMDAFVQVRDKSGMEGLVFDEQLTDKVSSVSDKIGLHNLQKEIGTYLVVEPYAEWEGGYNYSARLTVYDPETGTNVLELKNEAFNWSGLDEPLFYPLFNAFVQWTRGDVISTVPREKEEDDKKRR